MIAETVQLFTETNKHEAVPVGSGVLISVCEARYLITAAHVISESGKLDNRFVMIEDNAVPPRGQAVWSKIPLGRSRNEDKFDIAVIRLDSDVADLLSTQHSFLDYELIGINWKSQPAESLFCFGFPASKTRAWTGSKTIRAKPYIYRSHINDEFDYVKSEFDANIHLPIHYDGMVQSKKRKGSQLAQKFHGMSGGGVWVNSLDELEQGSRLVGLMIEGPRIGGRRVLIGTHINLAIAVIQQRFCNTDLGVNLRIKEGNQIAQQTQSDSGSV